VLPEGCRAVLQRSAWRVPPVFETLRTAGQVEDDEMFRTFNMGIGYVVVVSPPEAERACAMLTQAGETVSRIGEIAAGARGVEIVPGFPDAAQRDGASRAPSRRRPRGRSWV